MDFQTFVDQLIGVSGFENAAIAALNGEIKAKSARFEITEAEVAKLVHGFADKQTISNGFEVAGEHYSLSSASDSVINGRLDEDGEVYCTKTTQLILIGVYGEYKKGGLAANALDKFANYLIDNGY